MSPSISRSLLAILAFTLGAVAGAFAQQPPDPAENPTTPPPSSPPPSEEAEDRTKLRRIDEPATTGEIVGTGDHTVPPGGQSREVVSVFGATTIEGATVSDAVSVFGPTRIGPDATVGGDAVAVMGRLDQQGNVRGDVVSVMGPSSIDGEVGGSATSVLGNMHLGPKAVIERDVVVVGGRLTMHPDAVVRGDRIQVPQIGRLDELDELTAWVRRCVFLGRPLAFGENLGWAWGIALGFLVFYLLLALLFPRGIVRCAETLETRPGSSVLTSVLAVLLTPVAFILVTITVVGVLLTPLLGAGLMFAKLFGKAVMLAWIGRRITKLFDESPLGHPAFAVAIGGAIVLLLYTIPVLGFLTYSVLSWLGVGVVICTLALAMKRETRPAAATATTAAAASTTPTAADATSASPPPASTFRAAPMVSSSPPSTASRVSPGFSGASEEPVAASQPAPPESSPAAETPPAATPPTATPPPIPPIPPFTPPPAAANPPPVEPGRPFATSASASAAATVAWPRAGFFIRLGALAIDGVLVGLIMAFISGLLPFAFFLHGGPGGWLIILAIYGAVMWKLKGTTIGGIVCGLKVVRLDNCELDWTTAIVRALGCFLSLAVAGLGFIWVAIDDEKQSWHDKIAGTAVVQAPKGVRVV